MSTYSRGRFWAASESEVDNWVSMKSSRVDNEEKEKPTKLSTARREELRLQAEDEVLDMNEMVQSRASYRLSDVPDVARPPGARPAAPGHGQLGHHK